jgi:hypothetical protein
MEKEAAERKRRRAAEAAAATAQASTGPVVRRDPSHPSRLKHSLRRVEVIFSMADREKTLRRCEAMLKVERKKRLKLDENYSQVTTEYSRYN